MVASKRTALVTGANRGLGLETARQLAMEGIHVIVSARSEEGLLQARSLFEKQGLGGDFIRLDVTDEQSIIAAASYIGTQYGKLDILVNNAGQTSTMGAPPINNTADIPMDKLKEVYAVNVFGVVAVTQAMLPLIRKSSEGRIVNVSSGLGSISQHSDPNWYLYRLKIFDYDSSKAAVNQFTVHLAEALAGTDIKVNAVAPGWVRTDMGGPHAPLSVEDGARIIVKGALLPSDGPTGSFFTQNMQAIPW